MAIGVGFVARTAVEEIALLVKLEQVMVVVARSYFGLQLELEFGHTFPKMEH